MGYFILNPSAGYLIIGGEWQTFAQEKSTPVVASSGTSRSIQSHLIFGILGSQAHEFSKPLSSVFLNLIPQGVPERLVVAGGSTVGGSQNAQVMGASNSVHVLNLRTQETQEKFSPCKCISFVIRGQTKENFSLSAGSRKTEFLTFSFCRNTERTERSCFCRKRFFLQKFPLSAGFKFQ